MDWNGRIGRKMPEIMIDMARTSYRICKMLKFDLTGKIVIEYLVVSVGQACNFKCKDCGNFAPFSRNESMRYDVEKIKRELVSLLDNCKYIGHLQIQGGEPFVYSDLDKLVSFIGQHKDKIHECSIATNGSMVPSDKILTVISKNNICIRISDYGRCPEKTKLLQQQCEKYGIKNYIYRFVNGKASWYYLGGIKINREDNNSIVKRRYRHCLFRSCFTLENGKITYCSRAANSYAVQGVRRRREDYLDIKEGKDYRRELAKYIIFTHPMEACRYCHGTEAADMIFPAVQMDE